MAEMPGPDSHTNVADAHTARQELKGRKIAITGGTTGIGRAIAVLLASEGAHVFICGRTQEHLDDALARIREVGVGDGIRVDLAAREGIRDFFDAAHGTMGGIDVAVINAAIAVDGLTSASEDELFYAIATDFTGYLFSAYVAANSMGEGSDIVLVGSMSAVSRKGNATVYVAAKSGVQGFATALRQELAPKGIRVGLIEPGLTGADMLLPDISPDKQRQMIAERQMLRAEDIAVSVHHMLTQPRRACVSMMRVEPLMKQ